MPEATTTEKYKKLTESSDGRNVMPKLQATSHFYLDNNIENQDANQAFGPISGTQFRTTHTVSVNVGCNVYAICKGQIIIQPQTGSDNKINLILKPFEQPINGLSIKYFIYRGLNKSDFISGDNNLAAKGVSGFIDFIREEFENYYEDEDVEFLPKFIGFSPFEGKKLIADLFFNITSEEENTDDSSLAFESPIVPRGTVLGSLAANDEIGLDIILNFGDYFIENDSNPFQLNLNFARASHSILDTNTGENEYQKKLIKEACTQFIDPVAFYGLHANGAGKLYFGAEEEPLVARDDVYGKLSKFYTKNRVYLYIQSEFQRSFNYYNNYFIGDNNPNNIKIGIKKNGIADVVLSEIQYGSSSWPIHFISHIDSPEYIQLQFLNNKRASISLFFQLGHLLSEHDNNFIPSKTLFDDAEEDANFTTSVKIANTPIINIIYHSSRIIAKIQGEDNDYITRQIGFINTIFGPIDLTSILKGNELSSQTAINKLSLLTLKNSSLDVLLATLFTKSIRPSMIEEDTNTATSIVTYQTLTKHSTSISNSVRDNSYSKIDRSNSSNQQLNIEAPLLEAPYYFDWLEFSVNNLPVKGVVLKKEGEGLLDKYVFGITKLENDSLIEISNEISNSRLFLAPLDEHNYFYQSPEGVNYKYYSLGVIGEDREEGLIINFPEPEIRIYTIDEFFFFTKEYTENIKSVSPMIVLIKHYI